MFRFWSKTIALIAIFSLALATAAAAATDPKEVVKQVVDKSAVVGDVDDRHRRGGKLVEILDAADLGAGRVLLEIVLQGDRAGDLAAADQLAAGLEDAGMAVVGEMLRTKEIADLLVSAVVGEDRAKQLDLRLEVMRRAAQGEGVVVARLERGDDVGRAGSMGTRTLAND